MVCDVNFGLFLLIFKQLFGFLCRVLPPVHFLFLTFFALIYFQQPLSIFGKFEREMFATTKTRVI